jgi:small subunit ribosomal protein S20
VAAKKRKPSALKRMRQTVRRTAQRRPARTAIRSLAKRAREATGDAIADAIRLAQSAIDRAAERGIIHPNQAARRKARLMKAAAKKTRA